MRYSLTLLAGSCAFVVAACSSPATMTGTDASTTTVRDMAMPPPPPAFTGSDNLDAAVPAMLSCTGAFVDPAAPTTVTAVHGVVKDFQDSYLVVGATVSLYKTTADVLSNTPAASSTITTAKGEYDIMVPAGQYRWIRGIDAAGMAVSNGNMVPLVPTYEFGITYNDNQPVAVKVSTLMAIPGLVSVTPLAGYGIVAGATHDCMDHLTVGGVHIEVTGPKSYDTDGVSGSEGAGLAFYFVDVAGSTIPVRTQHYTAENGAFAALNVDAPGTAVVTGRGFTGSGAEQVISTASVPVIADAITIAHLVPNGSSM